MYYSLNFISQIQCTATSFVTLTKKWQAITLIPLHFLGT